MNEARTSEILRACRDRLVYERAVSSKLSTVSSVKFILPYSNSRYAIINKGYAKLAHASIASARVSVVMEAVGSDFM